MEHGANMTSLMIVIGIAFFIPILLHRLKLNVIPVVVAEIICSAWRYRNTVRRYLNRFGK